MRTALVLGAALVALATVPAHGTRSSPTQSSRPLDGYPAAPQAVPIPPGRQVFVDIADVPWVEFSPGLRRRTVAGDALTFSSIELDPARVKGFTPANAHHHDYEQVLFGVDGAFTQFLGGTSDTVGPGVVNFSPPNVAHVLLQPLGHTIITALEFMPIVRSDLLPPRPAVKYPASPSPRPLPTGARGFVNIDREPWAGADGTARYKAVLGETSSFVVWSLPASTMRGTREPGHHHAFEQLSYVLSGRAEARIGDEVRRIGPGTLMIIPADVDHLALAPVEDEELVLIDFQPVVREDLRKR